jgi:predicted porin
MMKRKALAIAVGALFVAPAAQAQITFGNDQTGTLQLYGKLYPQYGWWNGHSGTTAGSQVSNLTSGSNATPTSTTCAAASCAGTPPPPRTDVEVGNSYIGFRGERNLGQRLKGIWQIETATNFNVGTGTWASRDSFVGLTSQPYGTVRLGQMDTVYKRYGDTMSMFGIASGNFVSASNVLSQAGIGLSSKSRFHERRTNYLDYETPTFSNLQAAIGYGPDEAKGVNRNGKLISYGVKWDTERFYASVHQEQHYDFFGVSSNLPGTVLKNDGDSAAHSKDVATRASGEIRFAEQRIVLDLARLRYNEYAMSVGTPRFQEYTKTNWAIGWDGGFGGPWRFAAQYVRAGSGTCTITGGTSCSTTGLSGTQTNFGVRYRFDRQTFVYAIASRLKNDTSALYSNSATSANSNGVAAGGSTTLATAAGGELTTLSPVRGGTVSQAAIGISYSF